MSTFIGQLVGFAVIVWLIWRYVVPPVRKLMADQQNTVRQQLADSSAAADRLAEASRAHAKAKEDAQAEAQRLTEEAQSDAKRIGEQLRLGEQLYGGHVPGEHPEGMGLPAQDDTQPWW